MWHTVVCRHREKRTSTHTVDIASVCILHAQHIELADQSIYTQMHALLRDNGAEPYSIGRVLLRLHIN